MAHARIYGEPATGDPFSRRRRTGIGGSDTAALLGLSTWRSRLGLWEVKRGLVADTDSTERMLWGQRLEHAIRRGYVADTGRRVIKPAFSRHAEHPFVIGHPDGITPPDASEQLLLEVKTTAWLDAAWGPDGSDRIPAKYYSQVQHYLLLKGYPVCDVAVLVGGREMHIYTVPADPEFQQALLVEEESFWREVVDGTPPDPDGSADAGRALRQLYPSAIPDEIVATPEVVGYAAAYEAAKAAEAKAKREKDHAAQLMQAHMGERSRMVGPGFTVSWPAGTGAVSWRAVAKHLAELQLAGSGEPVEPWLAEVAEPFRGEATRGRFTFTAKGQDT